jgi:hypothetical protein
LDLLVVCALGLLDSDLAQGVGSLDRNDSGSHRDGDVLNEPFASFFDVLDRFGVKYLFHGGGFFFVAVGSDEPDAGFAVLHEHGDPISRGLIKGHVNIAKRKSPCGLSLSVLHLVTVVIVDLTTVLLAGVAGAEGSCNESS